MSSNEPGNTENATSAFPPLLELEEVLLEDELLLDEELLDEELLDEELEELLDEELDPLAGFPVPPPQAVNRKIVSANKGVNGCLS
mgnify:CR=1 FL=1